MTPGSNAERVVLDDIDARPGSATSLLRTTIGLYLRRLGGRVSSAALVRLAGDLGVAVGPARTAITRLKQRGLLLSDSASGYRLNPAAVPMLERGDRRIFELRQMAEGDPWTLVSATMPESQRALRHQVRRRLGFIGAGGVAPGLWILPATLEDEAEHLVTELGARDFVTMFRASRPRTAVPLPDAVAEWWDLGALRSEHLRFLSSVAEIDGLSPFSAQVRLVDSWRVLPYVDPGLPTALLPDDWPGERSFRTFADLNDRFAGPAWTHVRGAVA